MNVSRNFTSKDRGIKGMTLIEVVLVLAIIAFLVALAVPAFTNYVRKANRAEAQQLLMQWANNQEIWRANHTTYAGTSGLTKPSHDNFNFFIRSSGATCADDYATPSATAYTLLACATSAGGQDEDQQMGKSCAVLSLNQSGAKGSYGECWGRNS